MALLARGGRRERRDAHVTRVERGHQALDRASFARGIPSLEHHANRWPEAPVAELAPELEAQRQEPPLARREAFLLLFARQPEAEVELGEPPLLACHEMVESII